MGGECLSCCCDDMLLCPQPMGGECLSCCCDEMLLCPLPLGGECCQVVLMRCCCVPSLWEGSVSCCCDEILLCPQPMGGECLPCCCVLTTSKILMCHEDVQTNFVRTLGSANVTDTTSILVDSGTPYYCVLVSTPSCTIRFLFKYSCNQYIIHESMIEIFVSS